jgi:hypothetical protein
LYASLKNGHSNSYFDIWINLYYTYLHEKEKETEHSKFRLDCDCVVVPSRYGTSKIAFQKMEAKQATVSKNQKDPFGGNWEDLSSPSGKTQISPLHHEKWNRARTSVQKTNDTILTRVVKGHDV